MRPRISGSLLTSLALLLTACGGGDSGAGGGMDDPSVDAATAAAPQEASRPDTTLESVWAYLQDQAYRENWQHWPETDELYSGGEPHGMLLTTYVNAAAMSALEEGASVMPTGAIIVKENFSPDSVLAAVTVMYKTDSFNPEHGNWWFLKRNADGSVDAAGRGAGCQDCHGQRADNDYIMTSDLGGSAGGD